jgi:hypothetical protein
VNLGVGIGVGIGVGAGVGVEDEEFEEAISPMSSPKLPLPSIPFGRFFGAMAPTSDLLLLKLLSLSIAVHVAHHLVIWTFTPD